MLSKLLMSYRRTLVLLSKYGTVFASKRSLARILSTFLCCLIVVIKPFARFGGRYAFLVLSLKELVFSVQASLAQQLELTVLNIFGALLGIAVSTLAKLIASRYPENSTASRATCAVFLVLISFFGEYSCARAEHIVNNPSWIGEKSIATSTAIYPHILLRIYLDPNRRHRRPLG